MYLNKLRLSKSSGFTLIELLTRIAIIGMMAAIRIPAISGIRLRVSSTTSMTNLRQIGLAANLYLSESGGRYARGSFF